jgi:phospholipase/carboxylesterase
VSAGSDLDLGFVHRHVVGANPAAPALLLLHGTGGDENDLVPLGARIAPGSSLLSPRGKVRENGMPRFFRRLAEGVFDLDDLTARTYELADFVTQARAAYSLAKPYAVGFSNGANIAAALLLLRPEVLAGAILMRATLPLTPSPLPDLAGVPVLILSGADDPLVTPDQRDALARVLTEAGADVSALTFDAGHGLTPRDISAASQWLSVSAAPSADRR